MSAPVCVRSAVVDRHGDRANPLADIRSRIKQRLGEGLDAGDDLACLLDEDQGSGRADLSRSPEARDPRRVRRIVVTRRRTACSSEQISASIREGAPRASGRPMQTSLDEHGHVDLSDRFARRPASWLGSASPLARAARRQLELIDGPNDHLVRRIRDDRAESSASERQTQGAWASSEQKTAS